jgi:hypothetical protein
VKILEVKIPEVKIGLINLNSSEIAWNWRDRKGGRPEPLELDLLDQSHGWLGGLPPRFYPR